MCSVGVIRPRLALRAACDLRTCLTTILLEEVQGVVSLRALHGSRSLAEKLEGFLDGLNLIEGAILLNSRLETDIGQMIAKSLDQDCTTIVSELGCLD